MPEDKYKAQKKYLASKKQLRVWVDSEKYKLFKKLVEQNDTSIYSEINNFIAEYCKDKAGE